jgi:hypothetical protein
VNDLRFQFSYWGNHNLQAAASDCSAPCVAGTLQGRNTRRYALIEGLSWQKGEHRLKFGGDLNPINSAGLWGFCTPMCVGRPLDRPVRARCNWAPVSRSD